jgi:uncharacterized protein YdaU (DUF1376 family)
MGKQPYIPFYIGDYIKATRILPLAVRGAWVDLILNMWENPVRGELTGTYEDFSRMMSCTEEEARFAINLLMQKKTADITLHGDGTVTIVSRRMKRDCDISSKRADSAKKRWGKEVSKDLAYAKTIQKPEYENEYEVENEIVFGIKKESRISIKKKYIGDRVKIIYDLQAYFDDMAQLSELTYAGWTDFSGFMKANPGAVFEDDSHLYNSYRKFCTTSNGKKQPAFNIDDI